MVDEYMLTEAEVSFIKLLETLDRTAQHHTPAVNSHQPELCNRDSDCAVADLDVMSPDSISKKSAKADMCSSSSSSSNASGSPVTQHSDTRFNACCTQAMPHAQLTVSSADEQVCRRYDEAQGQSPDQAVGAQDLGEAQFHDTSAKPTSSAIEPDAKFGSSRHVPLHSSASSHALVPADLHSVANARFKDISASKGGFSTNDNASGATGASTGISRQDSDQEWRLAACNLLCNARVNPSDGNNAAADSVLGSAAEPSGNQQEMGMSNMQLLIMKAKELQVGVGWGHEWVGLASATYNAVKLALFLNVYLAPHDAGKQRLVQMQYKPIFCIAALHTQSTHLHCLKEYVCILHLFFP